MQGEEGEICIRGTCLTHGYYGNQEKTKEAFVQNPLNPYYPELIYRTGDIGKRNAKGELVFVSRKDYQIKHMGHRIELGEIEANVPLSRRMSTISSLETPLTPSITIRDRKSTRLNSSHCMRSRMPSSA